MFGASMHPVLDSSTYFSETNKHFKLVLPTLASPCIITLVINVLTEPPFMAASKYF